MAAMMLTLTACPSEPDDPDVPPVVETKYNYDLYVCAVKHGGMSQNKNGTYLRSVESLEAGQPIVEFTGKGIDITTKYTMESITRDKYYYQVPQEATGGFVKFHIVRNAAGEESVVVDAEKPFKENTYYARKYTHAWLDDGATLLVIGTDSKHEKIYWSKLAEADLTVKEEGVFPIELPEGFGSFSTAGILTLRPSDGKLFYFYFAKPQAGLTDSDKSQLYIAVINPATMAIESNAQVAKTVMEETAGSAYGELMQTMIIYDEAGTMYVAGLTTSDGEEVGILRRIRAGQTTFDASWNGFPTPEGKLLTIQYLGDGKALAYARVNSLGTKIDSESHFYTIINLTTTGRERVKYNGTDLPYCSGRFSQRSVVVDGKAYIGITEGSGEQDYPAVYIYDCKTGKVEEGIRLSKGFCFDIIRAMVAE